MELYNFSRAIIDGKQTYKVSKGNKVRYCLARSLEQCQRKFTGWNVEPTSFSEFWNQG
jgi:hypothetical protein